MSHGPGRWQRWLLDRLRDKPEGFAVTWDAEDQLERPLTGAEHTALLRAARTLERTGRAGRYLVWGSLAGIRKPVVWLQAPGQPEPEWRVPAAPVSVHGAGNTHLQQLEKRIATALGGGGALRNGAPASHFVTPPMPPMRRFRLSTGHTDWNTCAVCGAPLDHTRWEMHLSGRSRDYCSPKCRQKAYRMRKRGIVQ